ncbi:MAG: hypothetical protein QM648_06705 [Solirubrobacterales bacterium]
MYYGRHAVASDRVGSSTLWIQIFFAIAAALSAVLAIGAPPAGAAFTATGWSQTPSTTQAGGHPSVTFAGAINAAAGDANGDDLSQLQIDLPAGLMLNPQAVTTPCATVSFNSDACPTSTQVGTITISYRIGSITSTSTGAVYSITPDANSVINFGFVVRPTNYQKFLFTSGRATGLTTVRSGLDADYGLSILVPNIPRTIKSTIGLSTAMTISNIAITLNSRTGSGQTGGYFVYAPTRCDAANSRATFTSYAGAQQSFAAGYAPTGCDKLPMDPDFTIKSDNASAGQATGISATVKVPTAEAAIQQTNLKNIQVTLPSGTTVNLGVLNATGLCTEVQLAADGCPATAKIGTANVNVPFLPAAMTGEIYLTSRSPIEFAYIVRGARGTIAILRGSAGIENNGVTASFQTLPQVPWSSATLSFSATFVNNPANSCPYATAWGYFTGYSGAQSIIGALYPQTNCPPDTTFTATPGDYVGTKTPQFYFNSNPAGANFQCRVDSGAWTACASPYTVPTLSEGQHSFGVRAVGATGAADPTPATRSFTVDVTPPAIDISSPSDGATLTGTTVTLNFTTEAGAVSYCRLDLGAITECNGTQTYSNLTDGAHKIRVISRDLADNLAYKDRFFTVATVRPPVVTISSPIQGSTQLTNRLTPIFTAVSPNGKTITSVRCAVDTWYPEYDYSDLQYERACASGIALPDVDTQSPTRLTITATDSDGNVGTAVVTFASGPRAPAAPQVDEADRIDNLGVTERQPVFHLDVGGDANWPNSEYDCSLVSQGAAPVWTPCGNSAGAPAYQPASPLAVGSYVFSTRARSNGIIGDARTMAFSVGDWSSAYSASTTTTQAGAHPDLDIDIDPTGAGQMRSIDVNLPKGLIGSLNSFPRCPDANLAKATCPAETKIGSVDVDYTIYGGIDLKRAPGDVYFTGPQAPGDVAGMVIRVFGPVKPYADVIIPLRIQLTNNSQVMRVFSDAIPTVVGDIYDPARFIKYWLLDFKMHINGSAGSPFPLLTNPSRCSADQFAVQTGDIPGNKTAVQAQPYAATGCASLPFAPTMTQQFSSTAAGTETGVVTDVDLPSGNSSIGAVSVAEPSPMGPNYPAFGRAADRCPGSAAPSANAIGGFDVTGCNAASVVGTASVVSPVLQDPLLGSVYLINKTPLPYLGIRLVGTGIDVRFYATTALEQLDPTCTVNCEQRYVVKFASLPDLPITHFNLNLNQPDRGQLNGVLVSSKLLALVDVGDPSCIADSSVDGVFTPGSGNSPVTTKQAVPISGC